MYNDMRNPLRRMMKYMLADMRSTKCKGLKKEF